MEEKECLDLVLDPILIRAELLRRLSRALSALLHRLLRRHTTMRTP